MGAFVVFRCARLHAIRARRLLLVRRAPDTLPLATRKIQVSKNCALSRKEGGQTYANKNYSKKEQQTPQRVFNKANSKNAGLVVPHEAAGMPFMQNPAKWLGQVIGRVDDAMNEFHDNCTGFLPVLNGKVLDVDVVRVFSRHAGVDHVDGRLVITVENRRATGRKSQLSHDRAQVFCVLSSSDGRKEFSFGRAGGGDRLGFAVAGYCTST